MGRLGDDSRNQVQCVDFQESMPASRLCLLFVGVRVLRGQTTKAPCHFWTPLFMTLYKGRAVAGEELLGKVSAADMGKYGSFCSLPN